MEPVLSDEEMELNRAILESLNQRPKDNYKEEKDYQDDEDDEMRLAIMESLEHNNTFTGFNPLLSPREVDEEEDPDLQEAIEASIRAADAAKLATLHINQLTNPLTEEMRRLQENRNLRRQQDIEYENALRADMEKAQAAQAAALFAAQEAEKAARKLAEMQLAEEIKRNTLQPPILVFPLEKSSMNDIFMIRFKLPSGAVVNHSFHRNEPLSSVLQQLRFDLKYTGELVLTVQPRLTVTCPPTTPISNCGFGNRIMVLVDYP